MRLRGRIVLTTLTTLFVVGAAVASTSANRLSVSEVVYLVRWTTTEPLHFISESETYRAVCSIRLKGRFHSATITKTNGLLIARVEESRRASCSEGNVWVLNGVEVLPEGRTTTSSLPWSINYRSFTGTLPAIARIRVAVIGFSILINELFESCLFRSTATSPVLLEFIREANGSITGARADETALIPAAGGVGFCPSLKLSGTAEENTNGPKSAFLRFTLI